MILFTLLNIQETKLKRESKLLKSVSQRIIIFILKKKRKITDIT